MNADGAKQTLGKNKKNDEIEQTKSKHWFRK